MATAGESTPGGIPRYPILLMHGLGGVYPGRWANELHSAAQALIQAGIPAAAPTVPPYHTIAFRSALWAEHLAQMQDAYKADKVNLLAFSMGGLDARYLVRALGAHAVVASVTTLSTPHHGTAMADYGRSKLKYVRHGVIAGMHAIGRLVVPEIEPKVAEALDQLSPTYVCGEFNPRVPDHPEVAYFSYLAAAGRGTDRPITPLLMVQNRIVFEREGLNDGLVSLTSARWGTVLGVLPADHLKLSGWSLGGGAFDRDQFLRRLAAGLAERGF